MAALNLFPARVPFVNLNDGTLTPEALRALQIVYGRLGGAAVGVLPATTVILTGSPFIYTAESDGYVVVTGGTVTMQEYGRIGLYTSIGSLNSLTPVNSGDTFRVTYTVAPTMTFIPK